MPKQSHMIHVNSDVLRDTILRRGHISDLKDPLGVSKQAINGWLAKGRIPPRQLSAIGKHLKLDANELEAITNIPKEKSFVLFRTNRNVAVPDEVKSDVIEVADEFFQFEEMTEIKATSSEIKITNSDPGDMAKFMLRQLKLERSQLSISSVLSALKDLNIHVLFYDFGDKFVGAKAQAVCVKRGKKAVIFINSHEMMEDILWRVFHEVCHLFSGHTNVTKADEEFCSRTATQTLTPDKFFIENKPNIKKVLAGSVRMSPFVVETLAKHLSSSFEGVLLGLKNHKIIDGGTEKYLWRVCHNRKKNAVRVNQVIRPQKGEDTAKFWLEALEDSSRSKFFQLQHFVRMGIILDKISSRRAAELLDTDEITMQQLGRLWLAQYEKKNNL